MFVPVTTFKEINDMPLKQKLWQIFRFLRFTTVLHEFYYSPMKFIWLKRIFNANGMWDSATGDRKKDKGLYFQKQSAINVASVHLLTPSLPNSSNLVLPKRKITRAYVEEHNWKLIKHVHTFSYKYRMTFFFCRCGFF